MTWCGGYELRIFRDFEAVLALVTPNIKPGLKLVS